MRRWALISLMLLAVNVSAYELEQVLDNIENADQHLKAVSFGFVQDIQFTEMDSGSTITGEAVFAKPNRMKIEKQKPDRQITVSNGKKMWVYNPDFAQVWEGNWKNWVESKIIPQGLMPIGGYASDLRKRFNLELIEHQGAGVKLDARPKESELGYTLEIIVSTTTWLPSQTVFISDSARVATTLTRVLLDPPVKDSDFNFKAPPGVDVIPLN